MGAVGTEPGFVSLFGFPPLGLCGSAGEPLALCVGADFASVRCSEGLSERVPDAGVDKVLAYFALSVSLVKVYAVDGDGALMPKQPALELSQVAVLWLEKTAFVAADGGEGGLCLCDGPFAALAAACGRRARVGRGERGGHGGRNVEGA